MRRIHATIALAIGLAACQQSPSPPAATPVAVSIRVHDGAGSHGPLVLAKTSQLVVESSFPASPGVHGVRIDVVGPNGGLYGMLRTTASPGPDGIAKVSQSLEVSGTTIDHYHMVGTWQFALTVDEGPQIASASVDVVD
jgi:hypothetical protein